MSTIVEIIDHLHSLTPLQLVVLICVIAFAVIWKALDLASKNHRRGPHE